MVKIKKAQRGGCLSTTSSSARTKIYKQAAGEGSSDRMYRKEARQAARAERKEVRAAKKATPPAKYGKSVKKAQSGKALTKAAQDKLTDKMAKSLDKASVLGKNYIAPGDSAKKKAVKKPVPKKKNGGTVSMQLGSYGRQPGKNYTGKAKMGKSVGKCKYGC